MYASINSYLHGFFTRVKIFFFFCKLIAVFSNNQLLIIFQFYLFLHKLYEKYFYFILYHLFYFSFIQFFYSIIFDFNM